MADLAKEIKRLETKLQETKEELEVTKEDRDAWKRRYERKNKEVNLTHEVFDNANVEDKELYGETTGDKLPCNIRGQRLVDRCDRLNRKKED